MLLSLRSTGSSNICSVLVVVLVFVPVLGCACTCNVPKNNCSCPLLRSFNIFFTAAAKQNSAASKAAAKEARALMDRLGVAPDRITVNAQISRAGKEGRLDEAIETFERLLDGVRLAHEGHVFARAVGRLT